MSKLYVDLFEVNFLRRKFFGYCILLLLDSHTFQIYFCLTFPFLLLRVQNRWTICTLVECGGEAIIYDRQGSDKQMDDQ